MNITTSATINIDVISRRHRIETLIGQYPAVTDSERAEIISFFKTAPAIETAMLTCNDEIAQQLIAFKSDHRKQLEFGPMQIAGLATLIFGIVAIIYVVWDTAR